MKISLDLHGVINVDPIGFTEYAEEMIKRGHEIYILTGSSYSDAINELAKIKFDRRNIREIISTTDYLLEKDISWKLDKWGRPSFNKRAWWGAKGQIARERGLNLHIDDNKEYEKTFTTPFILYNGKK